MLKQTLTILVLTAFSASGFAQRPVKKELKVYKAALEEDMRRTGNIYLWWD
jgi:hypothetical protein